MTSIVCIGTRNILPEIRRFLSSLRAWGNSIDVFVYTPKGNPEEIHPSDLPVPVIPLPKWYNAKSRVASTRNAPACLKPDAILAEFARGSDSVLYMDCSDIMIVGDLAPLIEECEASTASLAARSFLNDRTLRHQNPDFCRAFHDLIAYREGSPYCNDGVFWIRSGVFGYWFLTAWKAAIQVSGQRFLKDKKIVGDQEDFNVFFRAAYLRGEARLLDKRWNIRGEESRLGLSFRDGGVYTADGTRAVVLHASGRVDFNPQTVEYCTKGPQPDEAGTLHALI